MDVTTGRDRQATVLIVDVNKAVADVYANQLVETYSVRTAYSETAALETLDSEVDVMLLDRRMPDLSGDGVLARLRTRNSDCRVVIITAVDPDLEIISLDFDEYLTKPVTGDELRAVIEAMLTRNEYDTLLQDAVALVSKMATLEEPVRKIFFLPVDWAN